MTSTVIQTTIATTSDGADIEKLIQMRHAVSNSMAQLVAQPSLITNERKKPLYMHQPVKILTLIHRTVSSDCCLRTTADYMMTDGRLLRYVLCCAVV